MSVEIELVQLIKTYSGLSKIDLEADLEKDLGIAWDDALELLTEYKNKFMIKRS